MALDARLLLPPREDARDEDPAVLLPPPTEDEPPPPLLLVDPLEPLPEELPLPEHAANTTATPTVVHCCNRMMTCSFFSRRGHFPRAASNTIRWFANRQPSVACPGTKHWAPLRSWTVARPGCVVVGPCCGSCWRLPCVVAPPAHMPRRSWTRRPRPFRRRMRRMETLQHSPARRLGCPG